MRTVGLSVRSLTQPTESALNPPPRPGEEIRTRIMAAAASELSSKSRIARQSPMDLVSWWHYLDAKRSEGTEALEGTPSFPDRSHGFSTKCSKLFFDKDSRLET